jgi:nucleotide-binding universal stress UspA family protein
MTYRIVVGTDFSDASSHALLHALHVLGAAPSGELHLTHVVLDADATRAANLERDEALMEAAFQRLKSLLVDENFRSAHAHDERFDRQVVYHVRLASSVSAALEQVALDVDAHLVVVGTHGRKGLEKWMLGSVADELLKNGRVPLLVARPTSFEGMKRSDYVEPAKPGVNIHAQRYDFVYSTERVSFGGRDSHISGLV